MTATDPYRSDFEAIHYRNGELRRLNDELARQNDVLTKRNAALEDQVKTLDGLIEQHRQLPTAEKIRIAMVASGFRFDAPSGADKDMVPVPSHVLIGMMDCMVLPAAKSRAISRIGAVAYTAVFIWGVASVAALVCNVLKFFLQ